MAGDFGAHLKRWRSTRRMSQLDLALAADVSARHLSFLEVNRAQPSREMIVRLADALKVPLEARNALLKAAGFAEFYMKRAAGDADLAPIHASIAWTLERHDPYPAMAIDRHWRILRTNESAARLLGAVGLADGDSLLDALLRARPLRAAIVNWPEVARFMTVRLRAESADVGGDRVLEDAANGLAAQAAPPGPLAALPAVAPTRLRLNGLELAFFSTIASFGTAEDVALADVRIELMFPADEVTRQALLALAAS